MPKKTKKQPKIAVPKVVTPPNHQNNTTSSSTAVNSTEKGGEQKNRIITTVIFPALASILQQTQDPTAQRAVIGLKKAFEQLESCRQGILVEFVAFTLEHLRTNFPVQKPKQPKEEKQIKSPKTITDGPTGLLKE